MTSTQRYIFTGDGRDPAEQPQPDAPTQPEPYVVADPLLRRAVNLAIFLRRPLLLEGEAGSGKSRLAHAVAYELNLPLYPWHVRSTSKAQDGLYTYDAILRLHDTQAARNGAAPAGGRDPGDPRGYRALGALGKAFQTRGRPAVVLIDEIDKADVDFPNDLLTVLDDPWAFTIPETDERIAAEYDRAQGIDNRPIIIVTSNKEKGNLPAPFLRRCVYHYIAFPSDPALLQQIVDSHLAGGAAEADETLAWAARFLNLRADDQVMYKKPGVSEFLDWVRALRGFRIPGEGPPPVAPEGSELPFRGLLLKQRLDWQSFHEPQ